MANITVRVRGIAIHDGRLLMARLANVDLYYHCLPGGRLETGETIEGGLRREFFEETGVKPQLGPLLFINQFLQPGNHNIEFYFAIKNGADYAGADFTKASHAHELADLLYGDPTDPKFNILPHFLAERFPKLLAEGDAFKTEIVEST